MTRKATDMREELNALIRNLECALEPRIRAEAISHIDELTQALGRMKVALEAPNLPAEAAVAVQSLDEIIRFLNSPSTRDLLPLFVRKGEVARVRKKRAPLEIPAGLSNDQIRDLLQKDLTKNELKSIATQRGISVGGLSVDDARQSILKNLERQEGYGRLGNPKQ